MPMKYSDMTRLFKAWQEAKTNNTLESAEVELSSGKSKLIDKIRELKKEAIQFAQNNPLMRGNKETLWFYQVQLMYNAWVVETFIRDHLTEQNFKAALQTARDLVYPAKGKLKQDAPKKAIRANVQQINFNDISEVKFNPNDDDHDIFRSDKSNNSKETGKWHDLNAFLDNGEVLSIEVKATGSSANLPTNFHNAKVVIIYIIDSNSYYVRFAVESKDGVQKKLAYTKPIKLSYSSKIPGLVKLSIDTEIKNANNDELSAEQVDAKIPPSTEIIDTDLDTADSVTTKDDLEGKSLQAESTADPQTSENTSNNDVSTTSEETEDEVEEALEITEGGRSDWAIKPEDLVDDIVVAFDENNKIHVSYNRKSKIYLLGKEDRVEAITNAKKIMNSINALNLPSFEFAKRFKELLKQFLIDTYGDVISKARDTKVYTSSGDPLEDAIKYVQQSALTGAIVIAIFKDKLDQIKDAKKKGNGEKRVLMDISSDEINLAKDWLKQHTRNIFFRFPENDDNSYVGEPSKEFTEESEDSSLETEARWKNALDTYLGKFPNAVEGTDYTMRPTSNPTERQPYCLMGPSAEITFDVPVASAPDYVKKMINNAKSLNPEATKTTDKYKNEKIVSSVPFVYKVLSLFNDDLYFYKDDSNVVMSGF